MRPYDVVFDRVLTRVDAPVGRRKVLTPSPVAGRAAKLGLVAHGVDTNLVDDRTTGFGTEIRQRETVTLLLVGLLTVIWLLLGLASFARAKPVEFLGGAVTGLVGALVGLGAAAIEARKGRLRWS